jgi:hypothetical protein
LTIIFILFAGTSIILTEVYLSANFKAPVRMDNATLHYFSVSRTPGVSPASIISRFTLTTNTQLVL